MTSLFEKLRKLNQELQRESGPLILFGLFEREGSLGQWDLVVSAPWLPSDSARERGEFFKALQSTLTAAELTELAGVVFLDPDEEFIRNLAAAVRIRGGECAVTSQLGVRGTPTHDGEWTELRRCVLNGMLIERAVLFTFQPPDQAASADGATMPGVAVPG